MNMHDTPIAQGGALPHPNSQISHTQGFYRYSVAPADYNLTASFQEHGGDTGYTRRG